MEATQAALETIKHRRAALEQAVAACKRAEEALEALLRFDSDSVAFAGSNGRSLDFSCESEPKTNRGKVCRAISGRLQTISQIAKETGLSEEQVSGVIYAPDLRDRFERSSNHAGLATFRIKGSANDQE